MANEDDSAANAPDPCGESVDSFHDPFKVVLTAGGNGRFLRIDDE